MSAVDIIERHGDLLVSSQTIAEGSGVEHRAVLQLVATNASDLEDFGDLAFEMRDRPGVPGPALRVALLNEQQATLLMTFQRNTAQVREFKKALVRAFFDMARRLNAAVFPQESPEQLMARALITAQGVIERKDEQIAVLTPRAEAWDELASATGDYAVGDAAKMLARAGVATGPQRLFDQLAGVRWTYRGGDGKWRAYASAVTDGYLAERPQSHHHPRTGELVLDPPQVRVTVRGLERLRVRLGSVVPELTH